MPTADRKLEVLRAIVEDFIATNEPVGSKTLADRHNLGVSPATIRNDMAVLEEEGLIAQPHTSAGRIPTDAGYRLFVDRLTELKPLVGAERRAIQTFLDGAADLDDVLHRAVRTARAAHPARRGRAVPVAVALAGAPPRTGRRSTSSRLMLVLITDTGRVEQRVVDLPAPGRRRVGVRPARDAERPAARAAARRGARDHRRPAAPRSPRNCAACSPR